MVLRARLGGAAPYRGFSFDQPPFARRKRTQLEFPEPDPMQARDRTTLAGEHPLHLMVPSFGQFQPGLARGHEFQFGGQARLRLTFQQKGSACEKIHHFGPQIGVSMRA